MSNPIFARLEQEAGILIHHGQLDAHDFQRVWRRIKAQAETPEYDSPKTTLKENPMSVLDDIRTDLTNVLENHRTVIEDALTTASKLAGNPLAQSVLEGFAHVPPVLVQAAIDDLNRLDAEFAKITPAAPVEPPAVPADPQIQTGVAS